MPSSTISVLTLLSIARNLTVNFNSYFCERNGNCEHEIALTAGDENIINLSSSLERKTIILGKFSQKRSTIPLAKISAF